MRTVLGREPVVFFEGLAAVLLAVIVLIPAPGPLTVALNAAVVAVVSLAAVAFLPNPRERVLPSLLAAFKALFAVWVGLGNDFSEVTQAGILGLVSAAVTLFVHQQVSPRLPAVVTPPVRSTLD